ncbi:MAG: VOC family protein [Desulfosarcinaceae bacterium]
MKPRIDHLVIGAQTLEQGVAYVKETLGVEMPFGGVHVQMGTHNHLMRLGPDSFLEVLAIDPEATPPASPRWYGLDDPFVRRRIERRPALLAWVVNTDDIGALVKQASISLGSPELLRRGKLSWYFGVPDDGRLLAGGMLPYVIQWLADAHPAANMADGGCRLRSLEIYHPFPSWLEAVLGSIGASDLVKLHALPPNEVPFLKAEITTPGGEKILDSQSGQAD